MDDRDGSAGATALSDCRLIEGLKACTLAADAFHHKEHVRLTWLYLGRMPVLEVLAKLPEDIRRFAAHHGADDLYHETITWAFVLLIHERMCRVANDHPDHCDSWPAFAERNQDLLAYRPSILDRYYRPETLGSAFARKTFVWPDHDRSLDPQT